MRKRSKLMALVAFIMFIGLIGCGISTGSLIIPDDKYKANYEKMFDAALTAGVKEGYKPTYQDKKSGLITMEKFFSKDTMFTINIRFGDVPGGQGFEIKGIAAGDAFNPFISGETNRVKNAILQAAGIPLNLK